jgi:GxxExxY protein
MEDIKKLCDLIRQTAYDIHRYHAHGHLEKVYENALAHRLRKLGLNVKPQYPLQVRDEDGTPLGDYFVDLLVNDVLIVELKATRAIAPEHEAQVLAYLRGTNLRHGLLINFGSPHFQVRKFAL